MLDRTPYIPFGEGPKLPPDLITALRHAEPDVPRLGADDRVLAMLSARRRARRRGWLFTAGPLAAAAGLALACGVWWATQKTQRPVDIVDAFALALQLRDATEPVRNPSTGRLLTTADVDALARQAVRIGGGA